MRDTYIKELRSLLEGEVEQAEVIIAAKGFSKELQDMIEKVGRLLNEDLGPVTDQMRQTYGQEVAGSFQNNMQGELEQVLSTLRGAKDSMDSSVTSLTSGESMDVSTDMDAPLDVGDDGMGMDDEFGDDGFADDEVGLEPELGDEFGDEFGAEDTMDEPLGRATKESKEEGLMQAIVEMRRDLAKVRRIQEQKSLAKKN